MASKNTRNFELKLGKQALVLFILGMSLLVFCVFLFGVMVGKHIDAYPEMVSQGIPDTIWKKLGMGKGKKQADVALQGEVEDPGDVEEGEFDLTFYETLTKKKAGSAAAPRHIKPGTEQAKVPAVSAGAAPGIVPGGVPGNMPAGGADKKMTAGAAADAHPPQGGGLPEEANGKKSPAPGDAGPGRSSAETAGKGYIIHVASFRDKGKADQLAKKLTALGHTAGVQMREVSGKGTWFRVVMNGFKTREEAQKALDAVGARIRGLKATVLAVDGKKD